MAELTDETREGLAAPGREAKQRELQQRKEADEEALKSMTEQQIEAARWSALSPSEWLYWSQRH